MEEYNKLRWDRLIEVGIEFDYIKSIVKSKYNYEVREGNLETFINNIDSSYVDIDIVELLFLLEENTYKKASVMHIKKFKKDNEKIPIIDDLVTKMGEAVFKTNNNINIRDGEFYRGKLTDLPQVTYYKKTDEFAIIYMAYVKQYKEQEDDDGIIQESDESKYECCKFTIDLRNENRLVIMYYNDRKFGESVSKEITCKKNAFRSLFNINKAHMIKYYFNKYLEDFFHEYVKEIKENNIRKSVSIIQASSDEKSVEEKSLIRSVNHNFEHSNKRIEAILEAMDKENLTISEIECSINDTLIDVQMKGDIYCIDGFLYKEVIENVCTEFFGGFTTY